MTGAAPPSPQAMTQTGRRRRACQHLAHALDHDQIRLGRARRLRLADRQPVADEVSMRWPDSGQPIAMVLDEAGDGAAARRLGQWLLHQALAEGSDCPSLSVPIPAALLGPGLAPLVFMALQAKPCPPDRLELRLSEAALLSLPPAMLVELCALRDGGVQLAIGDFGIRLGALTMLRTLPLTRLHLDPSLTYDLAPDSEDRALVAGLAGIAHAFNLTVSARAGDAPDKPRLLAALGIDQILAPATPAAGPASPSGARQASRDGP